MRMLRILSRNIRDSFKSVFRNFSLSLASISSITVTLLIVAISIILSYNADNITKVIKSDFTIVAFLNVDFVEYEEISKKLDDMDNISEYTFQSKKNIAEDMKNTSDVFENIISKWDESENPLQDTFLIKVEDTEKISETAKIIKEIEGVSLVRYGEGIVESLLSVFSVIEKILIIIVVSLILVTAFLISNTIKLAIFSRKKEIEIMRLVGASNINIKLPFVFEGLILGILGSIIPIAASIYGYNYIYQYFNGKLFSSFLMLVKPYPFVFLLSIVLISIGILVGMFGSSRAARKYLKI